MNKIDDNRTFGDFLNDIGLTNDLDGELASINNNDDGLRLLVRLAEEDIQQYLPDIDTMWGDEHVGIEIIESQGYVVWKELMMTIPDFYKLVGENNGMITPEIFKENAEKKNHQE